MVFDESIPPEDIPLLVSSSAAIPFIFEPMEHEHLAMIDGGYAMNVALGDPITRCMEEGAAPEDIIVDVILCQSQYVVVAPWQMEDTDFLSAWGMYKRREAISY